MTTGLKSNESVNDHDWAIKFSNFDSAWALTPPAGGKSKGEGIYVVHPDTGYTEHPELLDGGRVSTDRSLDRCFVGPYAKYQTAHETYQGLVAPGHGTHTGTVMMSEWGAPSPGIGIRGVNGAAPKVNLIPCRVTNDVFLGDSGDASLARAIHYACYLSKTIPVGVISISLGSVELGAPNDCLRIALKRAKSCGIIVCSAAGQGKKFMQPDWQSPVYPGKSEDTICVAACDSTGAKYDVGFYGQAVDITAPGVGVWHGKSTRVSRKTNYGDYLLLKGVYTIEQGSGTSYATAITAAACAMWQAYHGRDALIRKYTKPLLFAAFKRVLINSCHTPAGWDTSKCGAGILDAQKLLQQSLPAKSSL
ncbi:S8 family peptidase [Alkalimarinus alittae]|uniref:S8 family serine peptidase n=1 Tax=Alkalimarinus alittae TaxID=2961619 RepID=A0ABY6N5W5_9ALTE|nr:S8 family serine peptidase [Alkalimarinus alittae]UZE97469.1 S8 family serine peptidase [Alkalimarinus alittae]